MDEVLMLHGGGAGLVSFLARVTGIDATAMVRLRQLTDGSDGQAPVVDVFATTQFEVVAARRLQGVISRDGAVVGADTMLEALNATDPKLCRADGCAAPFAYFGARSLGALGCGFWFGVSLEPAVAVLNQRLRWQEFSVDFPKGPVARGCGSSPARKTRW